MCGGSKYRPSHSSFDSGVRPVSFSSTSRLTRAIRKTTSAHPDSKHGSPDVRILRPAVYFPPTKSRRKSKPSQISSLAADRTAKALQAITRTRISASSVTGILSFHATCKRTGAGVPAAFPGFRGETVASHCRTDCSVSPHSSRMRAANVAQRGSFWFALGRAAVVEPGNPGSLEKRVTFASTATSGQRYRRQ